MNREEILARVKELNKKIAYHYKYSYFNMNAGRETTVNKELSEKYGETRDGYEAFRSDILSSVTFTGDIAFREVTIQGEKEPKYVILEEKVNVDNYYSDLVTIYNELKAKVINFLNVQDEDMFEWYISEYRTPGSVIFNSKESVSKNIECLFDLIEEYQDNPEFKKYLDKIIS